MGGQRDKGREEKRAGAAQEGEENLRLRGLLAGQAEGKEWAALLLGWKHKKRAGLCGAKRTRAVERKEGSGPAASSGGRGRLGRHCWAVQDEEAGLQAEKGKARSISLCILFSKPIQM